MFLLVHEQWPDTGGSLTMLTVLTDGSVVALRWRDGSEMRVVRQLSPTGLAFVRAEIATVGLFNRSQTRKVVNSPACCGAGDTIAFLSEGGIVTVSRNLYPVGTYAPSAAWDRFDALEGNLRDPDRWVPAAGWTDSTWRPFHAATYCLHVTRESGYTGTIPPLNAADIAWPEGLRPFAAFGQPAHAGATSRVGGVSDLVAYVLAAAISERATAAGFPSDPANAVGLADGGSFMSPPIDDPLEKSLLTVWLRLDPMASGIWGCKTFEPPVG
jgi:hypothetical protein